MAKVGEGRVDVAGQIIGVDFLGLDSQVLLQQGYEVEQRDGLGFSQIENIVARGRGGPLEDPTGGGKNAGDAVVDIGVVAAAAPVAVERDRAAGQHGPGEFVDCEV